MIAGMFGSTRASVRAVRWAWTLIAAAAVSCGQEPAPPAVPSPRGVQTETLAAQCPSEPVPSDRAPGTRPGQETAAFWLDKLEPEQRDSTVVAADELDGLNARFSEVVGAWRDIDGQAVGDRTIVDAAIADRMDYLGREVEAGRYVEGVPGAFAAAAEVVAKATAVDHQRLVVEETPLACIPVRGGLFRRPKDPDFDRNACASLHPAERIRVLARGPSGDWLYVHAGHTVGWVDRAALTPRLRREQIDAWTQPQRLVPIRDDVQTAGGVRLRLGVSVPLLRTLEDGFEVLVPGAEGPQTDRVAADAPVSVGTPALTKAALLDVAFSEMGDAYGWGGRAGERDCSRYLRDLFATFGLQLARHSGVQAKLGVRNVDVSDLSPSRKRAAIRAAGARGVVLLYMRGHIMLYLGPEGGRDYALSAISEYLEPCGAEGATTYRIDEVAVTTLALGEGTARTSFLERIVTLVIFEPAAG